MMRMNQGLAMATIAAALCLGADRIAAQDNNPPPGGPPPGRGNFDPARFEEMRLERTKEQLEITDDNDWSAIKPLVQKVFALQRESFAGMGRGMFGGGRGPRGGDNANQGGGRQRMFGTPMPEAEALQRAIDGKASSAELKAAIAKYHEARKAKIAELEKAQADLRKVLSVRQEAVATVNGLL